MLSKRWCRPADDEGVAIVVSVAVMVVALSLALLVATVTVRENRSSGVDRKRAVAVNAAEAGLDATFTTIQASGSALPCPGTLAQPPAVDVPVDQPTVSTTVQYFGQDGVTPVTSCTQLRANAARVPMKALITSTATTVGAVASGMTARRAMQALVTVRPTVSQGFQNAIFSNGPLEVRNNHSIYGNEGNDADIYSNNSVYCPTGSNQTYQGSVYSQGAVNFQGQCSVLGKIWAKDSVSIAQNQTTVGNGVISSTSAVSLANVSNVAGTVMAGTTITPDSCLSPKCVRGLVQGPPPYQPFPKLPLSMVESWTAAPPIGPGYVRNDYSNCELVEAQLISVYAKKGAGQLVLTPCSVDLRQQELILSNDLVIYASGGFTTANQVTLKSDDGQPHKVYWIVPYGVSCTSTPAPGITTDNQFSVDSKIDLMLYTPCNISVANHSDHFGQVYGGGGVTINNNFDMRFKPMPMFGVDQASLPLRSYDVDVAYKREVRP